MTSISKSTHDARRAAQVGATAGAPAPSSPAAPASTPGTPATVDRPPVDATRGLAARAAAVAQERGVIARGAVAGATVAASGGAPASAVASVSGSASAPGLLGTVGKVARGLGDALGLTRPIAGEAHSVEEGDRRRAVEASLANGSEVAFKNGAGEDLRVRATQTAPNVYALDVNGAQTQVDFTRAPSANQTQVLAQIADYSSQQPDVAKGLAKNIIVDDAASEERGLQENVAAKSFGDSIVFFEGERFVNQEVFDHEIAHNVARSLDASQRQREKPDASLAEHNDATPDGWDRAVAKDGGTGITEYGHDVLEKGSLKEDFAEAYGLYQAARRDGPEAVAKFEADYPGRAAYLSALFDG